MKLVPANTAILIVRGDQEYVLQHRDDKPGIFDPGTYSPWGGGIEAGDVSYRAAAVRELKEEIGLSIDEADLIGLGQAIEPVHSPARGSKKLRIHYFALEIPVDLDFVVNEGQGKVSLPRPFEGHPKASIVTRHAIGRYENR